MTLTALFAELANRGVQMWAEGDDVRMRTPRGALSPELRDLIGQHKAELLALLRGNDAADVSALPALVHEPDRRGEPFPLTDMQHAYWVGRTGALELGNVATHYYVEIDSPALDPARLQTAWRRLIERHEMLRAVVLPSGEQHILAQVPPYVIDVLDLRGRPGVEVEAALACQRASMSHQVFSTDQWPLFDIRVTLLDGGKRRLHFSLDLLMTDVGSAQVLFREWHALATDPETVLPALEISFRDYVRTEEALRATALYQRSRAYWLERLDDLPPAPALPLARPLAGASQCFEHRAFTLEATRWNRLKAQAWHVGLTPSTVFLCAFADVLAHWSTSTRFTLNLTLFHRLPVHPQVKQIVGDFTTISLLALDHSLPESFVARARRLQQQLWQDLEHRYFSGVRVLRELARRRSSGPGATMPVVFTSALGLSSDQEPSVLSLFGEEVYSISQTPQVWLDHQLFEHHGGLRFSWDAAAALFPTGMLDDMFTAYRQWVYTLADRAAAWQMTRCALTPPAQLARRTQVNATATPVDETLLHVAFTRQARRTPNAPAVIAPDRSVSYGELATLAHRLGHRLRRLGAAPNRLVAIVMEKSWAQVVAALGILHAGAAYLPVDPELPDERRLYLLEQGEVELVVTLSHWEATLIWPAGITRLCLDVDRCTDEEPAPPSVLQSPEALAYVMFTSGSTGQPKGVMIDHRGAMNTIVDINRRFGVGPQDRTLALSALSFDLSVYDIFGLLAVGGAIVLPAATDLKDPVQWVKLASHHGVTIWNSVPALMRMCIEYLDSRPEAAPPTLRLLLLSGDWIPVALPDRIRKHFPEAQTISLGGATEASIWSIFHPITHVDPAWTSIPYGQPLANQTFHVLHPSMEPCPDWVPGQLYIGGIGLAKGYWRDTDKTNASFVTHPQTGLRLYKTGDLGRYLPDGAIEFLGREDFQVKINGYRIELGEIETALGQHPSVSKVVVDTLGEPRGTRRLVAYVVSAPMTRVQPVVLEEFLTQKLPDYMLPSAYLVLDEFPLSANGKVDRAALSRLALSAPASMPDEDDEVFVAPSGPIETLLAHIWCEVLGLERVGIRNNFFRLGGDSLLATRLMVKVRQACAGDIAMRDLYEAPTIAQLARVLEVAASAHHLAPDLETAALPTVVADPAHGSAPFPLTDVQQAYWMGRNEAFELGQVATHVYFEVDGENMDLARLTWAWQQLVERHDMLRAVILPTGQQQVLAHVPPYEIALLDVHDQAPEAIHAHLEETRHQMAQHVLATDRWPLFDLRATRYQPTRLRLHISIDVLIADAWSLLILFKEWSELYDVPQRPLPPLGLSFRDYVLTALLIRDMEPYHQARAYWLNRLDSLPPAPELPLLTNPGSLTKPQFVRRQAQLDAPRWERLKQRGSAAGLSPSGVLLAAFAEVLGVWSKTPHFCINLTLFNRQPLHPQVDAIVGDFTSLTLLEVEQSVQASFQARALRLQRQLWQDLDHRHMSGVEVMRELARRQGGTRRAMMPVVFTSALSHKADTLFTFGEVTYGSAQTPQVWLDHQVMELDGHLRLTWDAVEEIFPPGLLDDMFTAYGTLLEELTTSDAAWTRHERHLVPAAQLARRARTNATAAPRLGGLLHDGFMHQAASRPEALAVITPQRQLTYAEVDRIATRAGQQLRAWGARPNQLVAVVLEKGWEQIPAVLGILKAGAAYLPIAPELPEERRGYLLAQGLVRLVVTRTDLDTRLRWPDGLQRLCIDTVPAGPGAITPLTPVQQAEDVAYVIFTSGSTGQPKGVTIDHRGALNTVQDMNQRFAVGPADRVLAVSSLSFDLSVYDVFGILAAGGTVVLPDAHAAKDPVHWAELMITHRVTMWNSVPALLRILVEHLMTRDLRLATSLRLAMLSGDWIPLHLPPQVQALSAGIQIVSLGGATEASIWSIYHPIAAIDPAWKSIPYGKPLHNQQWHVLNHGMEPRPEWVPGDLYIGGDGLAQGYWRDPEKTAHAFRVHPRTAERLYYTGDVGRYIPDADGETATIEFLGREDAQVKINGYRIELGEIEAAVTSHPEVHTAVVTAVGDPRGEKQLVVYAVPEEGTALHTAVAQPAAPNGTADTLHSGPVDAYLPTADEGLLTDPVARLEFTLAQHGLRQCDPARRRTALTKPAESALVDHERRSARVFLPEAIPLERFGHWLSCLMPMAYPEAPLPKYLYPSAGSLYPVQTYLYVKPARVEGLAEGAYYHDPVHNQLVLLEETMRLTADQYDAPNRPIFAGAAFALLLIARLDAITPLYGSLAQDFCLLEAGYMGQLLMSVAPTYGIGLCPIGRLAFDALRAGLTLEPTHVLLHSFVGGALAPTAGPHHAAPSAALPSFAEQLRVYLQQKLPEYMVPHLYVPLEALPLTANGKINRAALPEPGVERTPGQPAYAPPTTPTESTVCQLWAELLGSAAVGIHDNFFELGGDSLKAIRVFPHLYDAFGVELPLRALFERPTVAQLAVLIDALLQTTHAAPVPSDGDAEPREVGEL